MTRFDRVLSDAELISATFKAEVEGTMGELRAVEQAVLAKLEEQEPVAYLYADEVYGSGDSDINDYIRANGDPLYTHPMPSSQGILDCSNHVVDNSEMVADMYWINPDYPSYTSILDAFDPVQSAAEVEIGDQFEVGRAKTLPDLIIEVTELEENGDVKDFKVLSGDHIADKRKMVTPLAQRKIQTLLDKGEYRVIENATVLVGENGHAAIVNRGGAFYWVDNEGLAREFDSAPKYTGEK